MRFGQYVKGLRQAKGLSQTMAARELGMSPQRLCDIENGRRLHSNIPIKILRNMAAVYDHPLTSLMRHSEFFSFERQILRETLDEAHPTLDALSIYLVDMLAESRQYTPELEELTRKCISKLDTLKALLKAAHLRVMQGDSEKSNHKERGKNE